ncbi:MAG TPA: hypothetical protein VFP54_05585 [Acidimicrobiales bacterium]|nr:hypothetical protein [Acidimicrobiales bacterium]
MKRSNVARAACGVAAAACALVGGQTRASADAPDKTAWFSTVPGGIFPPAPLLPAGDLSVGAGPAGSTTSFSAVQYALGAPEAVLTLTVDVANSQGTPQVVACPTTSPWSAGPDQSPSAAPTYDCSSPRSVKGQLSADGKTITFRLGPGQGSKDGGFSLAVVPDPTATSPFQLDVVAPKQDSLVAASPGPTAASTSGDAALGAPAPDFSSGSAPDGSSAALPSDSGAGLLGVGAVPLPGLAAGPTTAAPPAQSPPAAAAGPARRTQARPVVQKALIGGRRLQVLGVILLVDAVGTMIFLATKPERAPRLLGSLAARRSATPLPAAVSLGGVGRFARPRTGPPRRL